MDLCIKDRLALVTGASRGIGRAIATMLACEGARVILVARSQQHVEVVRNQLPASQRPHYCFAVDLSSDVGVPQLVEAIHSKVGEPDIVVHNLGGSLGVSQPFAGTKDWRKVWDFNVGIAHELNRAFIPAMAKRRWGRIVHLSTLSTITYNGYAPYVAAKCALNGYVKAVSREVSKDNVIVSAVAPGAIYSEGRYFARLQTENPSALEDYFKHHLPIGRLGTVEEIAPIVAFLCSDFASFMAGAIVGVDGGGM